MKLPVRFNSIEEAIRRITQAINANADGQTGTLTLTASAASTTLTDVRLTPTSTILLMPTTANASAEQGAGTIYIGTQADGSATVTHANNAQTDRIFRYSITG